MSTFLISRHPDPANSQAPGVCRVCFVYHTFLIVVVPIPLTSVNRAASNTNIAKLRSGKSLATCSRSRSTCRSPPSGRLSRISSLSLDVIFEVRYTFCVFAFHLRFSFVHDRSFATLAPSTSFTSFVPTKLFGICYWLAPRPQSGSHLGGVFRVHLSRSLQKTLLLSQVGQSCFLEVPNAP